MSQDLRSQPWLQSLQNLLAALPGLISDRLELLALELHLAGRGIVQIAMLMLTAAILGASAWLALCVGMALAMVALEMPWPAALLSVLLINLLLGWAALARARYLLVNIGLPVTRRHLAFGVAAMLPASLHVRTRPARGTPEDGR